MWHSIGPVLKGLGIIALTGGLAASVVVIATVSGPGNNENISTMPGTPLVQSTRITEKGTPQARATTPSEVRPVGTQAIPPKPQPIQRQLIPGADKGGLFADGLANLPLVDTGTWKTYSNANYGYSFKYPPDWQLTESDNSGVMGPNGERTYPLQTAAVQNPLVDQGRKTRGQNCTENDCVGPPPDYLRFSVQVWNTECNIAGDLVASRAATVAGRNARLCVVEYPNDKSRTISLSVPFRDGDYLLINLERGNSVAPAKQATVETILSTLTIK